MVDEDGFQFVVDMDEDGNGVHISILDQEDEEVLCLDLDVHAAEPFFSSMAELCRKCIKAQDDIGPVAGNG